MMKTRSQQSQGNSRVKLCKNANYLPAKDPGSSATPKIPVKPTASSFVQKNSKISVAKKSLKINSHIKDMGDDHAESGARPGRNMKKLQNSESIDEQPLAPIKSMQQSPQMHDYEERSQS